MNLSLGWDVGAWHCDKGSSRDALCFLGFEEDSPQLRGRPWRGNLREVLNENEPEALLAKLCSLCGVEHENGPSELVVAVDTPLGWPATFTELLDGHAVSGTVPSRLRQNPYLFRRTEVFLAERALCFSKPGDGPLSAVKDMIGSQSTKGMHFMSRVKAHRVGTGIWQGGQTPRTWTVLESYPTPCRESPTMRPHFARVLQSETWAATLKGKNEAYRKDVEDALWCALVAFTFTNRRPLLEPPPEDIPSEEGWIWVPRDCLREST